ncbi:MULTISPECIES: L-piperidine-6-carboxylate dehydrogenase [unclassified Sphingobacterium]|uniref:L-piperidine-6-carboxylate dehydrogenase n=1 Tax=unclassified Sphingobacterium TaxID=2609468 RepID=UPI00143B26A9|nr:aldehyde dehydrogenase family protein [Sphingobacterium sp. B16(2022)]NJI75159.1 aldehyde dehydrogenase family protein [Sphingobacterium sp. B16(2022)]
MIKQELKELGILATNLGSSTGQNWFATGADITSTSPVDGQVIATVTCSSHNDYKDICDLAKKAYAIWRLVPAPQRGEVIRLFGDKLRSLKPTLGKLVSYEMGKSLQEGMGEVQEMIDICDFAVGLSRQLYGSTIHSERPSHRMYDQYHPLGVVGVISAFNFPVAVWAWNTALALVCGDVVIWKPSEKTPLCAIACQQILAGILKQKELPEGISNLIIGDKTVGEWLVHDTNIPLISATGSTAMGKTVAQHVAARLGRSILELGGNNAIIITPDADLKMTTIGAVFGAVGTAGQRCTSTRRLIIHESVYEQVKASLIKAYAQLQIGDPLLPENHVGPLIDQKAVAHYLDALSEIEKQGGKLIVTGGLLTGKGFESGCYVKPAIAEVENHYDIVQQETFAPILYLIKYQGDVMEAIAIQNDVKQGLSSAIMTNNLREAELFLSAQGSDCGIANINIGTSGAEIGGAFGGEKETGGGRESGSDAWKAYMRRQTNTINYSTELPLAQGITFNL